LGPAVIALIIDSIILTIVACIIITILLLSLIFTGASLILARMGRPSSSPLISGILEVLYFVFFEVSMGATIYQKVLGLLVQMLNGSRVTFDKALIRDMSKIYPLLLLLDWLIGIASPGPDQS
jgi:uncharacterized RDD family membrane protein YckC